MPDIVDTLAEIRHEIKTPVNIISANAELISTMCKAGDLSAEEIESHMSSIRYYCKRLELLTDSVLSASKFTSGTIDMNCTERDIEEFFMSLIKNAEEYFILYNTKITVKSKLKKNRFCCDYLLLEQIVMNLIKNAIKYNDKHVKRISISLADTKSGLTIKVNDNGIGITEKDIDKIFDRFYRCDNGRTFCTQGTGLGLFIVYNLTHALGGNITAESQLKKGTEFTITIPLDLNPSNIFREKDDQEFFHPNLVKSYLTSLSDYTTAKELGINY